MFPLNMHSFFFILFPIIILLIISIKLYLIVSYGFWYNQPVVHYYDFFRRLATPQIINKHKPKPNNFVVFDKSILKTQPISSLSPNQKQSFLNLILFHYLKTNDGNNYSPKESNIWPYFIGHNNPSFISFYYQTRLFIDNGDTSKIISDNDTPIGTITSRPLTVYFTNSRQPVLDVNENGQGNNNSLEVYYVEFLCVHEENRKKGIAPKLIQTHEYNQRHNNPKIKVSLFKHEDSVMQGIVPLITYKTFGFELNNLPFMNNNSNKKINENGMKMIVITPKNMSDFVDFIDIIKLNNNQYDLFIIPEIGNLIELVKTQNIFIHVITKNAKIIMAYVYRNSCVQIEEGKGQVLTLIGSLINMDNETNDSFNMEEMFIRGFESSFYAITKKHNFGYCAIENISANGIIINALKEKGTNASIQSPCGYFFYNYIYPTIADTSKVFILN